MSDLISRQDAIDAMCQGWCGLDNDKCKYLFDPKQYDDFFCEGCFAVEELKKLPSAQPESAVDAEFWRKRADYYSDMCSKLIADMGAGVKIEAVKIDETGITFTKKKPSAQPEIIRCKDCKHKPYPSDNYDYDNGDCGFEIIFPDYRCPCRCDDGYYNHIPDDDWFCGNAERREDV